MNSDTAEDNLSESKHSISTARKILFGLGGTVSIFECFFVVLFFPYVSALEIPVYFLLPVCLLAAVIPVAVMPLLYEIINGSTFIAVGRYHIPLVCSSLGLSVFSALLFNIPLEWSFGARVSALFFSLMLSLVFLLVFQYVRGSMAYRLCPRSDKTMRIVKYACFAFGIAVFVLGFVFIYDGSLKSVGNIAFLSGALIAASGVSMYFSTQSKMPSFIRIDPSRKRNIKTIYKRFYGAFSAACNRRVYAAFFLAASALSVFVLSVGEVTTVLGADKTFCALAFLCCALSFSVVSYIMSSRASSVYPRAGITAAVTATVCFAVPVVRIFVPFGFVGDTAALYAVAVLFGASSGIMSTNSFKRFDGVAESSGATLGVIHNTRGVTLVCSVFTAFAIVSLSAISAKYGLVISLSVAAVMLIAAAVINMGKEKSYLKLEFPSVYD